MQYQLVSTNEIHFGKRPQSGLYWNFLSTYPDVIHQKPFEALSYQPPPNRALDFLNQHSIRL